MVNEGMNWFLSQASGTTSSRSVTRGASFASTATSVAPNSLENLFCLPIATDDSHSRQDDDRASTIQYGQQRSVMTKVPVSCWEGSPRRQRLLGRTTRASSSFASTLHSNGDDIHNSSKDEECFNDVLIHDVLMESNGHSKNPAASSALPNTLESVVRHSSECLTVVDSSSSTIVSASQSSSSCFEDQQNYGSVETTRAAAGAGRTSSFEVPLQSTMLPSSSGPRLENGSASPSLGVGRCWVSHVTRNLETSSWGEGGRIGGGTRRVREETAGLSSSSPTRARHGNRADPTSAYVQSSSDMELRVMALELLHMAREAQTRPNTFGPLLDDATFSHMLQQYQQQRWRLSEDHHHPPPPPQQQQQQQHHHRHHPSPDQQQQHPPVVPTVSVGCYERSDTFACPPLNLEQAPTLATDQPRLSTTTAATTPATATSAPRADLTDVLKSLNVDDKILQRIDHSAKFADDVYEYRFVMLPRNHPFLDFEADDEIRERLMTEAEWRAIGIRQTRGWEHFGYSRHESHVFLFRRPIGTDPRSGKVSRATQERVDRRLANIEQWQTELTTIQASPLDDQLLRSLPTFGSAQTAGPTDPNNNPVLTLNPVASPSASGNTSTLNGHNIRLMNWITGRNMSAVMASNSLVPQPSSAFFDLRHEDYATLDHDDDTGLFEGAQEACSQDEDIEMAPFSNNESIITGRRDFIQQIDQLYAAMHMPLYAS